MKRRVQRSAWGLDERRLRLTLGVIFLTLAVPGAVLVHRAFSQLELDAFRELQIAAERLTERVDARLRAAIAIEETRSTADYVFAGGGDGAMRRSPLSVLPVEGALPGTLGYFQVGPDNELSTPLLPAGVPESAGHGLSAADLAARRSVEATVRRVLAENSLVRGAEPERAAALEERALREGVPSARARTAGSTESDEREAARAVALGGQAAFDRLANSAEPAAAIAADARRSSNIEPLQRTQAEEAPGLASPASETVAERADDGDAAVEQKAESPADRQTPAAVEIGTFASELEPFQFGLLDTGHLVLFRNAWRDGRRFVQGALIDRAPFLDSVAVSGYESSTLAGASRLTIAFRGQALKESGRATGRAAAGANSLYRARLSPPFSDLELAFAVGELPPGPGYQVLVWTAVVLASVLGLGFLVIYRIGLQQIRLARQQRDFVSAVSHELKTPLTSIRMYGEMLRSGWATEDKKRTYYEFIYDESERLSRLIDNVLRLARLGRGDRGVALENVAVSELVAAMRSKIATQVERAGFELSIDVDESAATSLVAVDADALAQIFINLVDNAIKFAAEAQPKRIELSARRRGEEVTFAVRDFGPGVPRAELKRLFELFYRPENALTRATPGTGIGLALVHELVTAMNGSVDIRNTEPGAEVRLTFPTAVDSGAES